MGDTTSHAQLSRSLKARLLELTPRAFELFAGDLLMYVGLQRVAVTRQSGDGGIDARGELVADSGLLRISAGVQVKRYRRNVGRPEIDQLIGAYGGQFDRGIFITTAGYAPQARHKAATSPLLRVDTIDGDQVAALMLRHGLGVRAASHLLDEPYFLTFEAQAGAGAWLRDPGAPYLAGDAQPATNVRPQDDLVSLTALSYALRVDRGTARDWVERGRLLPDRQVDAGGRTEFLFRRDRVEALRRELALAPPPQSGEEWRAAFLAFTASRAMTKSYKPVLLKALLALADRNGEAPLGALARAFHEFYLERQRAGLTAEFGGLMARPDAARREDVAQLIVRFPLDRFVIQQFVTYDPEAGVVRFAPELWGELRVADMRAAEASADEQIRYYYERRGAR